MFNPLCSSRHAHAACRFTSHVVRHAVQTALPRAIRLTAVSLAAGALLLSVRSGRAAIYDWDGAGTSWNTAADWSTTTSPSTPSIVVPGVADTVQFDTSLFSSPQTLTLDGNQSVSGITFANSNAVTINQGSGSGTLTLGSGGITLSSGAGSDTIAAPLSLTGGEAWTAAASTTLSVTGAITHNAGSTVDFSTTGTFSGPGWTNALASVQPWAFYGSGTTLQYATISGLNVAGFTGTTSTVAAIGNSPSGNYDVSAVGAFAASTSFNTLRYTSAGAAGTITGAFTANGLMNNGAALIFSGAVTIGSAKELVLAGSKNFTFSAAIGNNSTNPSALTYSGTGTLTLNATNTFSGGFRINSGTVVGGNAAAFGTGTLTLGGGALTAASAGVTFANPVFVAANTTTNVSGVVGDPKFTGAFTGSGTFQNNETGGSVGNTYINGDISGFTGTINFVNGAHGDNFHFQGGTAATYNGSQAHFVLSGATTGSGLVLNTAGTMQMGDLSGTGGRITAATADTLQIGALNTNTTFAGVIDELNGGAIALTKVGTGSLEFSGANLYAGITTINNGTLKLTGTASVLPIVVGSNVAFGTSNTLDLQLNDNVSTSDSWTFANKITGGWTGAEIEKVGQGIVVLNPAASSSFVGSSTAALTVTAGKLYVNGAFTTPPAASVAASATLGGKSTVGAVTIQNGGNLEGGQTQIGALTMSSLTFGAGSGDTANVFAQVSATAAPLVVSGALTANGAAGSVTVNLTGTIPTTIGTYHLIQYGSLAGTAGFSAFTLAGPTRLTLQNDPGTTNYIDAIVSSANFPIWRGNNSGNFSGGNNWVLSTNTSTATDFISGDTVLFDDSVGTGTTAVNVNTSVNPTSTTFNNTSKSYTLTGSSAITSGTLAMTGGGTVSISNTNSFTGAVNFTNGTVQVATLAAKLTNSPLGTGAGGWTFGDATHNGTLEYTASTSPGASQNQAITINAGGGTIQVDNANATVTLTGTITGTGPLTKAGAGTLALNAATNYAGTVTISQGTLSVTNASALASTANAIIGDANSGATTPTLSLTPAQTLGSLTVAASVAGATLQMTNTNSTFYIFSGVTTLNSPLSINRTSGAAYGAFQNSAKITGNGGGSGADTLIFTNAAGAIQAYWQSSTAFANDFLGNVRVKAGNEWRIQSSSPGSNFLIPDASMLTLDSGSTWNWTTSAFTESMDGLAGAGTMGSNNGGTVALTINANNASNQGNRNFSGALGGISGALTLGGTGTQQFSGANVAYTNATNLNNGTLELTSTTAWGSNVVFGTSNTPDLQLNNTTGTSWTFNKQITGGSTGAIIEKVGSGTVVLTPANSSSFVGSSTAALTVTAGKLYVNAAFTTAPAASVAASATLGGTSTVGAVTIADMGSIEAGQAGVGVLNLAALTFNNTGTVVATVSGGAAPLNIAGALTTGASANSIAVNLASVPATNGTYHLIQYGSLTGTAGFSAFTFATPTRSLTLQNDIGASNFIDVVVNSGNYPIWSGANNGNWSGSSNWVLSSDSSTTDFLAFDNVVFDDTASGTTAVNVNTNVNPSTTVFNNTSKSYTVSGAGSITSGTLTMSGGGTLTISNTNSFTSAVSFNGGTTRVATLAATGTNSPLGTGAGGWTFGGGTLEYTGAASPTANLDEAITVAAGGGTLRVDNAAATVTLSGTISGSDTLTKSGPGGLIMTSSAGTGFNGTLVISNGKLTIANASAVGPSASITLGDANTGSNNVELSFGTVNNLGISLNSVTVSGAAGGTSRIDGTRDTAGTGFPVFNLILNRAVTLGVDQYGGLPSDLKFTASGPGAGAGNDTLIIAAGSGQTIRTSAALTTASSFTGNVHVTSGTWQMQNQSGVSNDSAHQNLVIPDTSSVTIDSGAAWKITHGVETIDGLNGGGTVQNVSGTTYLAATATLTVGGGNGNGSFSGLIQDGGIPFSLGKAGTGTQTLSTANTYTGGTTLSGGTLRVTNSGGSATGTGAVTLNGGVLASGPTGSVGGAVSAGMGAHDIAPGGLGSIGTLTLASSSALSLNSNSTLDFDVIGATNDLLAVTGQLALGSTANVAVTGSGTLSGNYTLATFASTSGLNSFSFNVTSMPAGYRLLVESTDLKIVSANNSSLNLAPFDAVVRSIVGGSQTATATLTDSDSTYDATYATSTTGVAKATAATGSVAHGSGTTNVAIGFTDYSAAGARSGTVTFSNTANTSDNFNSGGNVFTLDAGSAVVDNRTVTASSLSLGAVHVGGTGAGMSSLTTTGDDNNFTRVTVNGALFNSASSTGSYSLNQTFNTAGNITNGSVTLTTMGEGLAGESPINVNVAYTAQVFSGKQAWNPSFTSGGWIADADWTDTMSNAGAGAPGLAGSLSAGDTATFDNATAATVVSLGSVSPHVAAITLANTNASGFSYTIAQGGSGVLNLDNGGGTATITANSGGNQITAPIALDSNLSVTVTNSGDTLALNGAIGGTSRTLTKLGAGTLSLGSANSYSGGTTASAGTLRTAANVNNALGSGPLTANAAVNLGGNENIGTLSGSGSISVAAGKTLTVNPTSDQSLSGGLMLGTTGSGAALTLNGSNKLSLTGSTTLNSNSSITVGDGTNPATLRMNVTSASTVGSNASVTVNSSATLELDGMLPTLQDGSVSLDRASIMNGGTVVAGDAAATIPTAQQVGGIDGTGSVMVNDSASLTADHINQTSLVIGNGSTFTLAPSDSSGNPMGIVGSGQSAGGSGLILAGSLTPSSSFVATSSSLLGAGGAASSAPSVSLGGVGSASVAAVPEPSTVAMLLLGIVAALSAVRRNRRRGN